MSGHAVVVGRSMAGLGAAAALAPHFDRVTIIDRDAESAQGEPRKGVGQGRHLHNLLKGGQNSIEALLPGTSAELVAAGAVELEQSIGFRAFDHGQWLPERDLGFSNLSASRALIEQVVLERLLRVPGVEVMHERSVSGLAFDERGVVNGVVVGEAPEGESVDATLVVDATGLVSKAPEWLAAAGYERPPEFNINIGLSYSSAVFTLGATASPTFAAMGVIPSPPNKRGAFIAPIENDRWLVSLHTRFEQDLPTSHDEMNAFAAAIEVPDVADFLASATIDGPVRSYRKRQATWRRYDKVDPFPDGLLVVGDAMTSFNPVYGQGMSVAWLQAVALEEMLANRARAGTGLGGLAGEFFPVAARISRNAWNGSTLVDSAYEEVTGDMRPGTDGDIAFMAGLRSLLADDPDLHADYIGVGQMTTPIEDLITPERIQRVVALMTEG